MVTIHIQVIERKGAEVLVTRDCLSNLEGFRYQNMINLKLLINCKIKTFFFLQKKNNEKHAISGSTFLRTSTKVAVPQTEMLNLANMSTIALKNWTSTGDQLAWCHRHLISAHGYQIKTGTIMTTPPTASATSITGATPPLAYLQDPWH